MARFQSFNLPNLWLAVGDLGALEFEDNLMHFDNIPDIYDQFINWYKGGGNQKTCINLLIHACEVKGPQ